MNLLKSLLFAVLFLNSHAQASQNVMSYALKQGLAQGSFLLKAKKIENVLSDPLTPEKIKRPLYLSQELLSFAAKVPMKTGGAYKRFVPLDKDWITQVLIVAYRDRLELKKFHFPVVGEFPYKGFFDEEDAQTEEAELAKNLDVYRRKVPAFSSLGWFSDPLTSNLIKTDGTLVETLFHELVHLNFYFDGKSDFDEAFATWFSYKASAVFAESAKNTVSRDELKKELKASVAFDEELSDFMSEVMEQGNLFYKRKDGATTREKYFSWIKECAKKYTELKNYDKITWNNATIMSFATYYRLVPILEKYAQKNQLNYKEFLARVLMQKEKLVDEIEKIPADPIKKKCVQEIP